MINKKVWIHLSRKEVPPVNFRNVDEKYIDYLVNEGLRHPFVNIDYSVFKKTDEEKRRLKLLKANCSTMFYYGKMLITN